MQARLGVLRQLVAVALLGTAGLVVLSVVDGRLGAAREGPADAGGAHRRLHAARPTFTPVPPGGRATPAPTARPNHVGLVAGHGQYDTGAVCADGLAEVDVTTDVAQRVRTLLTARGYTVEILPEHDPDVPSPPVQGYRAAAFVSIHADSCEVPDATGFKVARWGFSQMAAQDDALVDCLYREYAAATLLPRHDESITIDMTNYYAFREIGADTPAAIIELGFLLDDRDFLDAHRYEMALGVANGVACFLGPAGADGSG